MKRSDQWVLVTGGSRGIGRGIVEALAAEGYRVVFTYRTPRDDQDAAVQIGNDGVVGERVDGTQREEVDRFAQRMIERFGAPYAIVNNAGITRDGAFLRNEGDAWSSVIDANLNSVFHMTRAFLPSMVEAGCGSVVQMSSVTAIKGNPGQTNYAATKAAALGFTRSLAHEVARFGIRVNAVLPGLIDTDMTREMGEAQRKSMKATIPMRRIGEVSDVADCVKFLISDGAAYITGQSIVVDGGLTA